MILLGLHSMGAAFLKTPELELDETEAHMLAKSIAGVAEHYDFGGKISSEALAWYALIQTAAMIYGPRVVAMRVRRKSDEARDVTPPQQGGF